MTEAAFATVALLVFVWAILSGALARKNITGPAVFLVAGYLLANPDWGVVPIHVDTSSIHGIAEFTLALVLFSDAARVDLQQLRRDASLPARLLGIGLPLSIGLGGAVAAAVLLDVPWALAGFVGAALAPTDAALSVQVIDDERIPERLRRTLNVESGLNDGIATPVVVVMLAAAAAQIGLVEESASFEIGAAFAELAGGLVIGAVAGAGGGLLLNAASARGYMVVGGRRLAALAIGVGAFAVALALGGNGFIAAFLAGIAFGAALDTDATSLDQARELPELGGELLALVVWFLFGAGLVPVLLDDLDAGVVACAVLSLTVVRMVPVLLSLLGSGLDRPSALFIGWFGPRGLASVVFALLAVEELGEGSAVVDRSVAAVTLTVLLSVVLHGITAGPGGRRFVQAETRAEPA